MSDPFDRVLRAAARRGRGGGVCPDADVLAAYLDNGLTSDERAAVESHASDCARCQEHLALVGAVSVERGDPEEPRSWLVRWGWLVPVATAVLVVAVWTRTPAPTETPAQPREEQSAAPADEAQPKANQPVPSLEQPAPAASPSVDARATPQRQEGAAGVAAGFERRRDNQPRAPKAAPPPAPASPPVVAEHDRVGQLADAARNPEEKAQASARALKKSDTAALQETVGPGLVAAASARELYRAAGSRIERSTDGGTTWSGAFNDASLTFTAAACAEEGACWFGTTAGVVVRTSAEGFVRTQLPERAAVVAIAAGRGLAATATVGGRRYETTDGIRWTPVTP